MSRKKYESKNRESGFIFIEISVNPWNQFQIRSVISGIRSYYPGSIEESHRENTGVIQTIYKDRKVMLYCDR